MKDLSKNKSNRKKKAFTVVITATTKVPETPYGVIRKTRKKRKNALDELTKSSGAIYGIYMICETCRVMSTIEGATKSFKSLQSKRTEEISFLLIHGEVITPSVSMCASEFMTFLSELQSAGYSGSARTLRYILGVAIRACEFQTDTARVDAKSLMDLYVSMFKVKRKRVQVISFLSQHNTWVSFLERLRIFEETRRIAPSINEMINTLNSREIFKKAPQLLNELKQVYNALSDHVHPSTEKIAKQLETKKLLTLKFDAEEFDNITELSLKVIDMISFLYLKSLSLYYGFKDCSKFLKMISSDISVSSEIAYAFSRLPFTRKLCKGITWKTITQKAKTRKRKKRTP